MQLLLLCLLTRFLQPGIPATGSVSETDPHPVIIRKAVIAPTVLQQKDSMVYTGEFISIEGQRKLHITQEEEQYYAQLEGSPVFRIVRNGKHRFYGIKPGIQFTFQVKDGTITGLTANRNNEVYVFKKQE